MTLRTGKLWKPCKRCGKMIDANTKYTRTCDDCNKIIQTNRVKKGILTRLAMKRSKAKVSTEI